MKNDEDQSSVPEQATSGEVFKNPIIIPIHSLTAKLFLNLPIEELIPSVYVKMAEQSSIPDMIPWIFHSDDEDGRTKNLDRWPPSEDRYMNLFRTLEQAPDFERPLYGNGSEFSQESFEEEDFDIQGSVIHELLEEVLGMMWGKDRATARDVFCHLSHRRCLSADMNYSTGHNERHYDAPTPSGFIALKLNRPGKAPHYVIPVSTTTKSEPFSSAMAGKIKMMLSQLYLHIRAQKYKADQLPDQEVFLLGLHGSRLHILRAFFPGEKSSTVWCGRYSFHFATTSTAPAASSDSTSSAEIAPAGSSASITTQESSNCPTPREIDLDNEPDLRTFRVLATREFDLWNRSDFRAAVRALVALNLYLISGLAQIGPLQAIFEPFPPSLRLGADGTAEKREKGVLTERCENAHNDDEESGEEELTGEGSKIRGWWGFGAGDEIDFFEYYVGEGVDL